MLLNLSTKTIIMIIGSGGNTHLFFSSSWLSAEVPQVRIVKADDISGVDNNDTIVNQTLDHGGVRISGDDDNISTIVNTDLKWPVIDMEVDYASGLLYALHDHTTIWKINTTSGEEKIFLFQEKNQDKGCW